MKKDRKKFRKEQAQQPRALRCDSGVAMDCSENQLCLVFEGCSREMLMLYFFVTACGALNSPCKSSEQCCDGLECYEETACINGEDIELILQIQNALDVRVKKLLQQSSTSIELNVPLKRMDV